MRCFSEQCSVSALWTTKTKYSVGIRTSFEDTSLTIQLTNNWRILFWNGICIQMAEANDELFVMILASWDAKNIFPVQRSFFFPTKEFFAVNFFREKPHWQETKTNKIGGNRGVCEEIEIVPKITLTNRHEGDNRIFLHIDLTQFAMEWVSENACLWWSPLSLCVNRAQEIISTLFTCPL